MIRRENCNSARLDPVQADQCAEEVGGGYHPLELELEGLVRVVDGVVVHVAPLGAVAVEMGVRVQLYAAV